MSEGKKRGFGAMPPEKRREAGRKGGLNGHPEGRAFAKDKDLAREAGRKGGARRNFILETDIPILQEATQGLIEIQHTDKDAPRWSQLAEAGFLTLIES